MQSSKREAEIEQRLAAEFSTDDLALLGRSSGSPAKSSPAKRKRNLEKHLDDAVEAKQKQKLKSDATPSTPEKFKCRVSGTTVTTPIKGTQYVLDDELGTGNYGKVFRCRAGNGKGIALKKRLEFISSPHEEAKMATQHSLTVWGYGAFFCPGKEPGDDLCSSSPHFLTMPEIEGDDPETLLERYFDTVSEKENAPSLIMFGMLSVFIAVTKAYLKFSEVHRLVHGDAQTSNIKLTYSADAKELQADIIDFDLTQPVGELTCGEAGFHQGSELNEKIPASSLSDVYSVGFMFDEMLKSLIEKGLYSRNEHDSSQECILRNFSEELESLENLVEAMMLDKNPQSYKQRPSFREVLLQLEKLFNGIKPKLVQISVHDFNVQQLVSMSRVKPTPLASSVAHR